jgi:organic radical activating enzyme
MIHGANIVEIFSSIQGEGLFTGTPMTFVRFSLCSVGCKWCDTPEALKLCDKCKIESPPQSENFTEIENPISPTRLNEELSNFSSEFISITGGEPLLQADFLSEWLPTVYSSRRILLETSGIHFNELKNIIDRIHVISMDLKLPSSTGVRPYWKEHAEFLRTAISYHKEIYIKIVVTPHTTDRDLQESIKLISQTNKYLPVFIQPASPTLTFNEATPQRQLESLNRLFNVYLPNVKVAHQMHKQWGIL